MRSACRQAGKLVRHDAYLSSSFAPVFLCPALLRAPVTAPGRSAQPSPHSRAFSAVIPCRQQAEAAIDTPEHEVPLHSEQSQQRRTQQLPRFCPGCGAPTQLIEKDEAGYYNIDRRQIKAYIQYNQTENREEKRENILYEQALKHADPNVLDALGLSPELLNTPAPVESSPGPETPVCDRCHNLIHHNTGVSIHHPSIDAIKETIAESPHRRNHIYHVLDAADFPLSLVPNLIASLRIPKLRTHNRRAKHKGWVGGDRIAEISFIVTRADLLAPLKEQVDSLLPYVKDVLRDALGRVNRNARLGNVYLVSAKRGWWTKKLKEDIWDRGGAGWMVGKVNVGKSNLFEAVFPKGPSTDAQELNVKKIRSEEERAAMASAAKSIEDLVKIQEELSKEDAEIERASNRSQASNLETEPEVAPMEQQEETYDSESLLPPPQPYTPYPVLPLSSSLPGTTASPIRIPFGRNRGELIDLPGLARTNPDLTTFVNPQEHWQLNMSHRITAHRHVIKPSQSLVLGGGLIRITPVTPDLVFLVHPFVPIAPHITHTEKAIGLQTQTRESGVGTLLLRNTGETMKSAGSFKLKWDATKKLAGPLTSSIAGKMKPENLPFRIWSTDILIEGVGWVEVSAQTRRHRGWKPAGLQKKDPNHARHEKLRLREEKDALRQRKREGQEGDAFDRAGVSGSSEPERVDEETEEEWYPEIEVFSPLGKYIGARAPMCGSVLGGPKYVSSRDRKARPKRSMVSAKRQRKSKVAS